MSKKLNDNNLILELFTKTISNIQQSHNSKIFSLYNKLYNGIFKRFFKPSSVSIIFRIHINRENLMKNITLKNLDKILNDEKLINQNIDEFQTLFNKLIRDHYRNSPLKYFGNKAFEINDLNYIINKLKCRNNQSEKRKINFNEKNKDNKTTTKHGREIDNEEKELKNSKYNYFEDICNNIEIEILFVKRSSSEKDKYSGNIAFPGGRCEKSDLTSFDTSVRETFEEIGINLLSVDESSEIQDKTEELNNKNKNNKINDILALYLCPNLGFDVTMDMKNFISSHIFLVVDLKKNLEKNLFLNQSEIANVLFVPIKFFYELENFEKGQYHKTGNQKVYLYVDGKIAGKKCKIKKVILNNEDQFLLYGMTLRKIIGVLNSYSKIVRYQEDIIFDSFSMRLFYKIGSLLLNFFNNSRNSFNFLRNCLIIFSFYLFGNIMYKRIDNLEKRFPKF